MKYRLPILICVLLLTIVGIFWVQPRMKSVKSVKPVKPSVNKSDCIKVKKCLGTQIAWPPGMEYCSKELAPKTVRSRSNDGKWGYSMNFGECSKDEIISPRFDTAEKFGYNGLAKVSRNGKWGYINLKGEEIIQLRFDEVGDFDFGKVRVRLGNKWGYYDAQGLPVVLPDKFDMVSGVWRNERSAVQLLVQQKGELVPKWGYITPKGDLTIEPHFDRVTEFRDGLAKVEQGRKWGLINTDGKFLIEPAFDAIFSTPDPRLLLVSLNRKYGYFDINGKEIIPPRLVKPVEAKYNSGRVRVKLNAAALTPATTATTTAKPDVYISAFYFLDSPKEKLRFDENGKAQFWRNGEWFYISSKGMLIE